MSNPRNSNPQALRRRKRRRPARKAGAGAPASPELRPNAETWLDFTDLVFIDPVGTGYSRFVATGDDARKRFYSIDGDVSSIALGSAAGWKNTTACRRQNSSPARAM